MSYPGFLGAFPVETELFPFRGLTASVGMQSLHGAAGHLLFLPRTHTIMQGGGGQHAGRTEGEEVHSSPVRWSLAP